MLVEMLTHGFQCASMDAQCEVMSILAVVITELVYMQAVE